MRAKVAVGLVSVLLVFYAVVIGARAVTFITTGGTVAVLLGVALLVLPAVGLFLAWREIDFGRRSGRLAAALAEQGGLPLDDLPRRPSGRVDRAAADRTFLARRTEVEAAPDSWEAWYRLALAYDDAGDRRRARDAARRAIALHDDERGARR